MELRLLDVIQCIEELRQMVRYSSNLKRRLGALEEAFYKEVRIQIGLQGVETFIKLDTLLGCGASRVYWQLVLLRFEVISALDLLEMILDVAPQQSVAA